MTDDLKAKLQAAITAALDTLQSSQQQEAPAAGDEHQQDPDAKRRFGVFHIPFDRKVTGFAKFFE